MITLDFGGFEWDDGNRNKIQIRFKIIEVEEFFYQNLLVIKDNKHSDHEERFIAIGKGPGDRAMFVCFTMRHYKIRVISARFMRAKEVAVYEKHKKEY